MDTHGITLIHIVHEYNSSCSCNVVLVLVQYNVHKYPVTVTFLVNCYGNHNVL
jgi:hypothetical protein